MTDPGVVQRMFSTIAPRYDLLNRLLSLGMDQGWRKAAGAEMQLAAGDRALDLCCGTGDLALEIARITDVVGCDFSTAMLQLAQKKDPNQLRLTAGDALAMPFSGGIFDSIAIVFGIRNLADLAAGFYEVHRVLKPGGRFVVLEFSRPQNRILRALHFVYVRGVVPVIGRLLSPSSSAYQYLANTIMDFPDPQIIVDSLRNADFRSVKAATLSCGIVTVYAARG